MRKSILVVLVAPVWMMLVGCSQADQANGLLAAQAILGAAQQVLAATGASNQQLTGSLTSPLPGVPSGLTGAQAAPGPFDPQPLTLQSGVTAGTGSAADNAFTLASTAAQRNLGKANDGRLTLTQYGGPTDRTPDTNTQNGIGNRNNRLRATSLALSPNLIREYGLRGGEAIFITTASGTMFLGHYDDTTGNRRENNVIDVYDPTDRLGRDSFLAGIPAGNWRLSVGARNV